MTSIQRFSYCVTCACPLPLENGPYVTYADHVAAVAEAEQRVMRQTLDGNAALAAERARGRRDGYEQGQRDTEQRYRESIVYKDTVAAYEQGQRDAIAKAVAAVEGLFHADPCDCSKCVAWMDAFAAIKAVGETNGH